MVEVKPGFFTRAAEEIKTVFAPPVTTKPVYKIYYHPAFPIDRVREAIVVPKDRGPIWASWTVTPWKNWDSPRQVEFFRAMLKDICQNGIRKPILLWDYAVVTGGTRLQCAKALSKTTIPAILSLRSDLGDPPAGSQLLNQLGHPAILEHNPDTIIWKKDRPLYLSYPKWDYLKPTGSECLSGTVSFPGKPPSSKKQ